LTLPKSYPTVRSCRSGSGLPRPAKRPLELSHYASLPWQCLNFSPDPQGTFSCARVCPIGRVIFRQTSSGCRIQFLRNRVVSVVSVASGAGAVFFGPPALLQPVHPPDVLHCDISCCCSSSVVRTDLTPYSASLRSEDCPAAFEQRKDSFYTRSTDPLRVTAEAHDRPQRPLASKGGSRHLEPSDRLATNTCFSMCAVFWAETVQPSCANHGNRWPHQTFADHFVVHALLFNQGRKQVTFRFNCSKQPLGNPEVSTDLHRFSEA